MRDRQRICTHHLLAISIKCNTLITMHHHKDTMVTQDSTIRKGTDTRPPSEDKEELLVCIKDPIFTTGKVKQ